MVPALSNTFRPSARLGLISLFTDDDHLVLPSLVRLTEALRIRKVRRGGAHTKDYLVGGRPPSPRMVSSGRFAVALFNFWLIPAAALASASAAGNRKR